MNTIVLGFLIWLLANICPFLPLGLKCVTFGSEADSGIISSKKGLFKTIKGINHF